MLDYNGPTCSVVLADLPPLKVGARGATMDRIHLPDVAVLTKAEYDRLQYQLNKRQLEEERIRAAEAERRALHELSQEKVKHWSNTVLVSNCLKRK